MKGIIILLLGCVPVSDTIAQVVSITVNGNRNRKMIVDNRTYDIENNNSQPGKTFTLTNMRPGQYSLELVRINDNTINDDEIIGNDNNIPLAKTTTTFNVKTGFDVAIIIAPNGIVQVKEKQIAGTTSEPLTAMNDAAFASILSDIQYHWRNTRKLIAAQTILTNSNNYFTTLQVMQIVGSVDGDANKLAIAKLAYNRITDPSNFVQVYSLMSAPKTRDDLSTFIRTQSGTNSIYSYSETYRAAMNDQSFDGLLVNIKRNMDPATRVNMVTEIIANETNYFYVSQVRRLLELVEYESSRLQLLRDVYTHVVDPENYPLLYKLLTTDAAKIELIGHVKNAAENGGLVNYNLNKPAISDEAFLKLITNTREQFTTGNGITNLSNIFTDIGNYFTAQQAIQLITLTEGELQRLGMAKTAYRGVIDPWNFLALMDNLLKSPVTRNELSIYAYGYRPL